MMIIGSICTQTPFFIEHSCTVIPEAHVSEQFSANSVAVTLEWTHKNGVSYSISVYPEVAVNFTGRNSTLCSAQLTFSYDIKYNISVVASLCEIYS